MKKTFIILITALLAVSCSEKNKTDKGYYDTGELLWETTTDKSNNKLLHGIEYFKNGNVKSRYSALFINDSVYLAEGPYEEYYSDGSLKWKGRYTDGEPEFINVDSYIMSKIRDNAYIKFYGDTKLIGLNETISLPANGTYSFRINLNNIFPYQYMVVADDAGHNRVRDNIGADIDDYPHIIVTPDRECELDIVCVFADTNKEIIIGRSPSVTFKVKVFTEEDTIPNKIQ